MNSSKFESIGLFTYCFQLFKNKSIPLALLLLISLPLGAAEAITVTLHLEAFDNADIEDHKIFVREKDQEYDFTSPAWQGSGTICTLTDLEEDTTYFFVARTYDKSGNTSDNSNEIRFHQTSSDSPQPPEDTPQPSENPANDPADPNQEGPPEEGADAANPKTGPLLSTNALDPTTIEKGQLASTQWRVYREKDDICVFDATVTPATTEILLPRLILKKNTPYYFVARYVANTNQPLEWTPKQSFIDTDTMADDINEDGIPDDQEADPELDIDSNGTPDFLQNGLQCIKTASGEENIGLMLEGGHNVVTIEAMETVSVYELPIEEDIAVAPEMPVGMINFRLLVNRPGAQAELTVHLPRSAYNPDMFWYYLYDNIRGWRNYSDHVAFGDTEDTLILSVTDGGDGDADGIENGIIVSQSGPATAPATGIGGGNSSRACFIDSLF